MDNTIRDIEKVANTIESSGFLKEAYTLDIVANTLEKKQNTDKLVQEYKRTGAMGLCTAVDLKDCNLKTTQDEKAIRQYVSALLHLIDMTPVGELQVSRFGDKDLYGYSFSQFIMTSLLSGHLIEKTRSVYLDIFSCKEYDPKKVVEFSTMFFEGTPKRVLVTIRQ